MSSFQDEEVLAEARSSLRRVQQFEPEELEQRERLGSENCFSEAIGPARSLIGIFKQLPETTLDYLPNNELNLVKQQSDALFNIFAEIMNFSLATPCAISVAFTS